MGGTFCCALDEEVRGDMLGKDGARTAGLCLPSAPVGSRRRTMAPRSRSCSSLSSPCRCASTLSSPRLSACSASICAPRRSQRVRGRGVAAPGSLRPSPHPPATQRLHRYMSSCACTRRVASPRVMRSSSIYRASCKAAHESSRVTSTSLRCSAASWSSTVVCSL